MATPTRIKHPTHGHGTVLQVLGDIFVVEFDSGQILKVLTAETLQLAAPTQAIDGGQLGVPLHVATKLLAHAIRSTSERWGVFSRSRVKLLPHQLWVAHKVLQRWPSRWLIADDVGLGKTIEAGLILSPLLGRKLVQRMLVLAPASLAEQWQTRLREMFDIRSTLYNPEVDKPKADFWNTHRVVVASLHTLRLDFKQRWERILAAEPWDLVIVDEAHHLNDDERGGQTLAMELLRTMDKQQLIGGLLLFTGTPHRGKDYGFLSLLSLLDAGRFSTKMPLEAALEHLSSYVIRNNKSVVTDMRGDRLFQPSTVHDQLYAYGKEEQAFYDKLTAFILSGKAFARSMQLGSQRTVMLVLITLQKLAASSVAAVAGALKKRLARLGGGAERGPSRQAELDAAWARLQEIEESEGATFDLERERLQDRIDELMDWLQISENELPSLRELVDTAAAVRRESRLDVLQRLISGLAADESLLIFTEYKVTQALIVSELRSTFGDNAVGFINGDGRLQLPDARGGAGQVLQGSRDDTAERFRQGAIRFLVSTEAAGEGIDLQDRCHTLVHYDLPWNPMRMHQRVGRLNRFGQQRAVEVHMMRNPATVEGRIWSKLLEKLDRIALMFKGVQVAPEDIHGLVLGAAPPSALAGLFQRGAEQREGDLANWFDAQTATLGGQDVVTAVEALVGRTAKFDFGVDAASIPKLDLPDLLPFVRAALRCNGKRMFEKDDGLVEFETPTAWRGQKFFVRERYERLHFDRARKGDDANRLLGTGVPVVEAAIQAACNIESTVAVSEAVNEPICVFEVVDAVHTEGVSTRAVVVAAVGGGGQAKVVADWGAVAALNLVVARPDRPALQLSTGAGIAPDFGRVVIETARSAVETYLATASLAFRRPEARLVGAVFPATADPMHNIIAIRPRSE